MSKKCNLCYRDAPAVSTLEFSFDSQNLMGEIYKHLHDWLYVIILNMAHLQAYIVLCTPNQSVQLFYLNRHSISDEAQCRIWGTIIWALNPLFVKYNSNSQLSVNLITALEVFSPNLTCFSGFLLNKIQCLLYNVFQPWNSTWAKHRCKLLGETR